MIDLGIGGQPRQPAPSRLGNRRAHRMYLWMTRCWLWLLRFLQNPLPKVHPPSGGTSAEVIVTVQKGRCRRNLILKPKGLSGSGRHGTHQVAAPEWEDVRSPLVRCRNLLGVKYAQGTRV